MTIQELLQSDPSQPLVNQGQARIADKRDERAMLSCKPNCVPSSAKGSMPTGSHGLSSRFSRTLRIRVSRPRGSAGSSEAASRTC